MANKKFKGSLVILIILIIICWPAAIIYFLMKREEEPTRTCINCGANIPMNYTTCPQCGKPTVNQGQYYQAPPPQN